MRPTESTTRPPTHPIIQNCTFVSGVRLGASAISPTTRSSVDSGSGASAYREMSPHEWFSDAALVNRGATFQNGSTRMSSVTGGAAESNGATIALKSSSDPRNWPRTNTSIAASAPFDPIGVACTPADATNSGGAVWWRASSATSIASAASAPVHVNR